MAQKLNTSPCRNCGQHHPVIPGTYSSDCVIVGGRSHSSPTKRTSQSRLPPSESLTTVLMPATIREQAALFDQIWFWFLDIKHENDNLRQGVAAAQRTKGSLKAKAPLLWLQWKRWDGLHGQTRNQENYEKLWKSFVSASTPEGQQQPVAWLTLRAMSSEASPPSSP